MTAVIAKEVEDKLTMTTDKDLTVGDELTMTASSEIQVGDGHTPFL